MSSSNSNAYTVPLILLLPLRLSVGLSFLIAGQGKLAMGEWGSGYEGTLYDFATSNLENTFEFYRPFLESIVIPNADKFAVLVTWGELTIGFSIFLGLFTRLGAMLGVFFVLNYTFTQGTGVWMPSMDTAYLWSLVTLLICSAGRGWGVDQVFRSRKRIKLFT